MSTWGSAQQRWYARNRERLIAEKRAYRKTEKGRSYSWGKGALLAAKERGFEIVEEVDPMKVYHRDKGICQICFEPVDLSISGKSSEGAQLDHTEPIHSYATVQLAHMKCNLARKTTKQIGMDKI